MNFNLHHVHLFVTDLNQSIKFYHEMFGAEIISSEIIAGVCHVLIRIGTGHINFYEQQPMGIGKNNLHHLGILTDDIAAWVDHINAKGINVQTPIHNFGDLKYILLNGPDGMLIKVFEKETH